MVRICLLDSYGAGFSAIQSAKGAAKKNRMDQVYHLCGFADLCCSIVPCSFGNILYYTTGIILAFSFKDNRAFCKHICPITVFLKPMSYFSLIRLKCDKEKCISCGKCKRVCPMNVDVTDNSRKRKNGTECILCMECVKNCPKDAL